MAGAKAKTQKAVTKSDIAAKAERWARLQKQIGEIEAAKAFDDELNATIQRHAEEMQPFVDAYDAEVAKLEERADGIREEIFAWLRKQKKAITIEAKHAIAKFLKGTKPGGRQPNPQQFIARCEELGKDPWTAVNVVIKTGEPILGKTDFDAICKKEEVEYAEASLELK
jgi:hypothetical protein